MIRLTAVIELEGHGRRALTHESNARTIILGRDPNNDFQIPLSTVSRQHSKITETDGVYVIEDLGSTHGTLINGKKITKGEKRVLRDGDVVELTKAKITAQIEMSKVVSAQAGEGTQAIAARAVQGILGRLGEPAEDEGPYMRVLTGPDEGQRHSLGGNINEWAMGRSKDCEMVLNDPNVSRKHGMVRKDWNGYVIQDLGSKNGVLVNDKRIGKPRRLKDRDEVTIGPIKLLFVDPDAELMAALQDVPGFEMDDLSEPEGMSDDPSVMGAPGEDDEDGEGGDDEDGEEEYVEPEPEEPEEEVDEYADIDPSLLDDGGSKLPGEAVIISFVGVLIVAAVIALLLILA